MAHTQGSARDPTPGLLRLLTPPVFQGEYVEPSNNDMACATPALWTVSSPSEPTRPMVQRNNSTTTVMMSSYNLTSTILGAGILSLPLAFREAGLVTGFILLMMTVTASYIGCGLVLSAYVRTHKASYGDLAEKMFGPTAKLAVDTVVLLLNVGACAAYMIVIKSLLQPALQELIPSAFEHVSATLLTALLVFGVVLPLSCLKDISSLRYTSMLAFGFAVFLVVAVAYRSVEHIASSDVDVCTEVIYKPQDIVAVFRALPLFSFSFICHLNVLPVYEFLRFRSPTRMRKVFGRAMMFCTLLYTTIGVSGALRFCGKTPGNIIGFTASGDNCDYFDKSDILITVARLAQTLTCTLALPLIQYSTRLSLHSIIVDCVSPPRARSEIAAAGAERTPLRPRMPRVNTDALHDLKSLDDSFPGADDAAADNRPQLVRPKSLPAAGGNDVEYRQLRDSPEEQGATRGIDDGPRPEGGPCYRFMTTFTRTVQFLEALAIFGLSFLLAILLPQVSIAFGLIGATLCTIVCYILPALFYLGATAHLAEYAKPFNQLYIKRSLSKALLVYGVVTGTIGTIVTLQSAISSSDVC